MSVPTANDSFLIFPDLFTSADIAVLRQESGSAREARRQLALHDVPQTV
jgi:hypothetical protein